MPRKPRLKEIHLVCRGGMNVTHETSTDFKSGFWAVSRRHFNDTNAEAILLALHESKAELSYLQGVIVGFEEAYRREKKNPRRLVFHIRKTARRLPWGGPGSGEKGYVLG